MSAVPIIREGRSTAARRTHRKASPRVVHRRAVAPAVRPRAAGQSASLMAPLAMSLVAGFFAFGMSSLLGSTLMERAKNDTKAMVQRKLAADREVSRLRNSSVGFQTLTGAEEAAIRLGMVRDGVWVASVQENQNVRESQ